MDEPTGPDRDDRRDGLVHACLIWAALFGRTFSYKDIGALIGETDPLALGRTVGRVLERICLLERDRGRPLLGALAVTAGSGLPGAAFFKLAGRLGYLSRNAGRMEKERFWAEEKERIARFWRKTTLSTPDETE
jgi:hypothetical protein